MNMEYPKDFKSASIAVGVAVIVVIVMFAALFFDEPLTPSGSVVQSKTIGSTALHLNVQNVNPVMAQQLMLKNSTGVIINDVPRGTARRHLDLRRGDVILMYNKIPIHSVAHLNHLMGQSRQGDLVTLDLSRKGRTFAVSTKIPQTANVQVWDRSAFCAFLVVLVLVLTFIALFFNLGHRTVVVALGAVSMMVIGSTSGFFSQAKAFDSIQMSPIMIFIGMSIFSLLLEEYRFIDYMAKKVILVMKADATKVVLSLCLVTYIFSLLVNNLSTRLVVIPVTLYVAKGMNLNPIPVVIAEIISSNIGGASTMIGDFPNMLISSSANLHFISFIVYMAPICLVLLAAMLFYMNAVDFSRQPQFSDSVVKERFLAQVKVELDSIQVQWSRIKVLGGVMVGVIVAFLFLPLFGVKPPAIALGGGFLMLAIENQRASKILKKINISDVLFFICMFILVGGALHSGLLKELSDMMIRFTQGS
ncbi:MAG: PDZ domain-containing protein, partial [Planctomycetes bacterium]|nr:PDZ domain-containing protein [Planctomycetota bacterium]